MDIFIGRDIAWKHNIAATFIGKLFDARLQAVILVGKGKLSTLIVHCLCNTPCYGAVTRYTYN